jgi:protein arginine kinase activator
MNKKEKIDEKMANKFVKDIMNLVETAIKEKSILNKKPCPKCGASMQNITKTGKLGCSECWDWYYKDLQQPLYIAHGSLNSPENLVHIGKVPKNFKIKNEVEENLKMKIIKLKYKLEQAVKKEDYEQASQLRDIIKELETRIV